MIQVKRYIRELLLLLLLLLLYSVKPQTVLVAPPVASSPQLDVDQCQSHQRLNLHQSPGSAHYRIGGLGNGWTVAKG